MAKNPKVTVSTSPGKLVAGTTAKVSAYGPQGSAGKNASAAWVSPFGPLPLKSTWEANALSFGATHSAYIANTGNSNAFRYTATYYDAGWVYFQLYDYTKNAAWLTAARNALDAYEDFYLLPNNGGIIANWCFSRGMEEDWLRNGDSQSKAALLLMNQNGSYVGESQNGSTDLQNYNYARDNAYALMTKLSVIKVGGAVSPNIATLVNNALLHLDQWFGATPTATYTRPFMWALTCKSLIRYLELYSDARVQPAILASAAKVWTGFYLPASKSLKYTDVDTATLNPADIGYNSGDASAAPDLNLLILPVFGWLYSRTGDEAWINRGDLLWEGGVAGAYLADPKIYNQNYIWSYEYVRLRELRPATGTSFVVAYDVSGTVSDGSPVDAVTLTATGGVAGAVSSNVSGQYLLSNVPNGKQFTLTPAKSGYTFTPVSRVHVVDNAAQTAQNFTGVSALNYNPVNFFTGGTRGFWYAFDVAANNRTAAAAQAANGDAVAQVNDNGTGGFTATQSTNANRPLLVTNGINGTLPVIEVDTTDILTISPLDSFLNAATSFTFGMVWRPTDFVDNHYFFEQEQTTFDPRVTMFGAGSQASVDYNPTVAYNGNAQYSGSNVLTAGAWNAVLFQIDATNRTVAVYANNATFKAPTVVNGPAQAFVSGGVNSRLLRNAKGRMAYAFCHKNVLMTTQQRSDWFASVKAKYGLTAY